MSFRIIIVEDEPLSRHYLQNLLQHMPQVEVVGTAATEEEAVNIITAMKPDAVFMDIELHSGTGFEVLSRIQHSPVPVIFTTALEHHAINLIKASGVPFLQKPIDAEELATLMEKNFFQESGTNPFTAIQHLLQTLDHHNTPLNIALYSSEGTTYIALAHLEYVVASGAGTTIHLEDTSQKPDSRPLKEWEGLLSAFHFFRTSATHLVNLHKVKGITTSNDGIVLKNGCTLPLSPKKRALLEEQLSKIN